MARAPTPTAPRTNTGVAGNHRQAMPRAMERAQLRTECVIVQVGEGQPRPCGLRRGTSLLVATAVPHNPHMAVHTLEDQPDDAGHLVVHLCGGPAWFREHITALRSRASTIAGADIRLCDHRAIRPDDTRALNVEQLTPSHPDVRWHSAALNAGWLSPSGYYWIPKAWGHTSSDASGSRPCRHATSMALAADLTRMWAVAISSTVPDGMRLTGQPTGRSDPRAHAGANKLPAGDGGPRRHALPPPLGLHARQGHQDILGHCRGGWHLPLRCTISSRNSQPWRGATGSIAYPGPWLLWGWGSTTPSRDPGRPTSSCIPLPGNVLTLRTAKLRQRDTCRLTVSQRMPWHGHHGPHHPFRDNDDPWPAVVR